METNKLKLNPDRMEMLWADGSCVQELGGGLPLKWFVLLLKMHNPVLKAQVACATRDAYT